MRIVEGLEGSVEMRGELRLRFNHGRIGPWVRRTGHHRIAVAGPDSAWLRVPPGVHTYGTDGTTASDFTVSAGQREVVDTLHLALPAGIPMERHVWSLLRSLMDYLERHWQEPDEGLWEIRSGRRHFVHSKVMAWVAADRAVRMAEATGLPAPVERWREMRAAVHADVCAHGHDRRRGVFVQHYGGRELDAATLFVAKSGFLPPDDQRVIRTVDAVRDGLDHGGFVRRYDSRRRDHAAEPSDGLPGGEGAFLACSFWLADALAATGSRGEARKLFARVVALANDLGLPAEEWDPRAGHQLGNISQAFTHVALVNTAFTLTEPAPAPR